MDFGISYTSYLINGPLPVEYNCTGKTSEEWLATGQRSPIIGAYFIATGVMFELMYVFCLTIMLANDLLKSSCYKIMFLIGVTDMISIFVNSIATGYFAVIGAVYCTHSWSIHIGALGCACWCSGCLSCILLASNRICDVFNYKTRIFEGAYMYILLCLPIFWLLFIWFLTVPASFNSVFISWFFNPMNGVQSDRFVNYFHAINNVVSSVTSTVLNVFIVVKFIYSTRSIEGLSKLRRQVLIQSLLICALNAIAAYIYVYMQYFTVTPLTVLIGQLAWQLSAGFVPIIYFCCNKTIRGFILKKLLHIQQNSSMSRVVPSDTKRTTQTTRNSIAT